jgi:hypothetical protein
LLPLAEIYKFKISLEDWVKQMSIENNYHIKKFFTEFTAFLNFIVNFYTRKSYKTFGHHESFLKFEIE